MLNSDISKLAVCVELERQILALRVHRAEVRVAAEGDWRRVRDDSDVVIRPASGKVRRVNHEGLLKTVLGDKPGRVVRAL